MQTKFLLISGLAIILSFVGGFLLANGLNKANIAELNKKNAELQAKVVSPESERSELTASEIAAELKAAESRPKDFNFQKRLAFELYGHAIRTKDTSRFSDIEKLLRRALEGNPDDYETIVAFANLNFQLGRSTKKARYFDESVKYFESAYKKRPKDLRMLMEYGSVLLELPKPEPQKAVDILEEAYTIDSKSEMVVNSLIKAYMATGNVKSASDLIVELKSINPQNPLVEDIENKLKTEASQ